MVIHINPNRINTPSGQSAGQRRVQPGSADAYVAPARAHVNHIPAPESLMTMIRSAVSALRQGVYWDRGTIVNLLV